MRVIIPMAGEGRRFREAGYEVWKPLITVRRVTMLEWALWSAEGNVTATTHECHFLTSYEVSDLVGDMGSVDKFLDMYGFVTYMYGPTEGAACTVLAAAVGLPPDEPLAVMNCDQVFVADVAAIERECLARGDDGFILTFTATDSKWSFVETTSEGRVLRVAEKEPISDQATVGFYWFRQARDLVWAIATAIHYDQRVKGEFYLAPVYNNLIRQRWATVRAVPVEWFHGLGTPEDVAAFEALPADAIPLRQGGRDDGTTAVS